MQGRNVPTHILEKHLSGGGDSTDNVPAARVCWASWIKREEAGGTGVGPATEQCKMRANRARGGWVSGELWVWF